MVLDDVVQVEYSRWLWPPAVLRSGRVGMSLPLAIGEGVPGRPRATAAVGRRRSGGNPRSALGEFVEHLILRAEAIWNFQTPLPPPPRPWWKLWSKEEREPELPAIVADLCNVA